MKNFLSVLFVFAAFSLPVFAVITPEEATSVKYIQNHGYSGEMSRLIDLQNVQINGAKTRYVSKEPALYSDIKVNFIRRAFMYFDCGLDDGKFMQRDINYSTRWNDL